MTKPRVKESGLFEQGCMKFKGVLLISAITLFMLVGLSSYSQGQARANQDKLDQATKDKVINWVIEELNDNYVYPEVAKKMAEHVRKLNEENKYQQLGSLSALTAALTEDLLSICNDKHLRVRINPNPPPPDTASDEEREQRLKAKIESERIENFTFKKVERLAGNVGYLRFDIFLDATYAGDTAVSAMNFLANCDALIIDLRYNGGGQGNMIQLILSYFFDEPVHYNNMYLRNRDVTEQKWTSAYVSGPKLSDVELFVLTSGRTFSAAEEFTYDLKNLDRATIIGQTTGGGAHPVKYHYLRELDVELKIPYGRSFNPKTGLDWEVVGIKPHIKTTVDEAFDKAYLLALKNLYENAAEGQKGARKWAWEYQQAILDPEEVDANILQTYVGEYGPARVILEQDELLVFEPGESGAKRLCALSEILFAIEGNENMRIEFEKNAAGKVIGAIGIAVNGARQQIPKTKAP